MGEGLLQVPQSAVGKNGRQEADRYEQEGREVGEMESVQERMERLGTKEKIATFMQKEKQPYEFKRKYAQIRQATKEGSIECEIGGCFDASYPESTTRRGRVQDKGNICPTLTAQNQEIVRIESRYRIRKFTPRECGRLMGVSDEDIFKMEKVNSDTQLYKQFGNSIVVNVMRAMFKNLNIDQ